MAITMKEIAKKAGVARSTASYILNNKWRESKISEDTRNRVMAIAEEYDYLPHATGRNLVSRRTHNIGIVLRSMDYLVVPYFATVISGIAHIAGPQDYNMQFNISDMDVGPGAINLSFTKKVKEQCVDGLIIIDQCVSDEEILWLLGRNTPFVLVDRYIPGVDIFCVRVDNKRGIYLATETLIKEGHKRIAFIGECMKWNKIIDMCEGYYQALREYEISVDKELIVDISEGGNSSLSTRLESILRIDAPPSAIICSSDLWAVRVLRVLKEMEINIPQDMALIGYNDDPNFAHVEPQLTTVHVPLREMGEESARILFSLIDGVVPGRTEVILEPSLIMRQSTKGYAHVNKSGKEGDWVNSDKG